MKLDIIPVIDLRGGIVVRAIMGRRDLYKPIVTPLSATTEPLDVVSGLLRLYPFGMLYVADLDAIEGTGQNLPVLTALRREFPHLDLWTDNAASTTEAVRAWLDADRGTLVLGSESQPSSELVRAHRDEPRIVLSLDFRDDGLIGPPELLDPASWPSRVIAMTLARVGGAQGPDFERLAALRQAGSTHNIYAAGGVRGLEDLQRLAGMRVDGVLVASTLHDGRLTRNEIAKLAAN
jgi:phosphoribosylformimino-5-aminoimidazole carboxamide ribotide isomerase